MINGFNRDNAKWDTYKAFHNTRGPLTIFDTGELICTVAAPHVTNRYHYGDFGVTLTTTTESNGLWAPDGLKLAQAWLDDSGMQYLLIDHASKRAVRLDNGSSRWGDAPYWPGVPRRFQTGVYAYIGGPDCLPIGNGKIVAWVPHREALTIEQRRHVAMIEETARAALKLLDHDATRGWMPANKSVNAGCPLDIVLKAQTWQDIPREYLQTVFHYGTQREKREYDYVLTEQPK